MFLFLGVRELNHDGSDIPVEALATPKSNANAEAGAPPAPNTATSNLATDARERFDSVFSTTPAGTTVPPQLPALLVQGQQDTAQCDPSMRTTIAASEADKLKTGNLGAGFSASHH